MLPAVDLERLDEVVGGRKMKRALHPEIWDEPTRQAVERWKSLPLKGAARHAERPVEAPPERPSEGGLREYKVDPPGTPSEGCTWSVWGFCLWR